MFFLLHIKRWVHTINILLIEFFSEQLHCLTESLEVDNLTFPQEFDYIVHIWIITQTENIIIGHTRFLLSCQILCEICNWVTFDRDRCSTPRKTGCCCPWE